MWRVNQEYTANERAWYRQKDNPTLCKYGCGAQLVFLKTETGQTLACEVRKLIFRKEHNVSVMLKDGTTSSQGERVGWKVHVCPKAPSLSQQQEEEDEALLPMHDSRSTNSGINFLEG